MLSDLPLLLRNNFPAPENNATMRLLYSFGSCVYPLFDFLSDIPRFRCWFSSRYFIVLLSSDRKQTEQTCSCEALSLFLWLNWSLKYWFVNQVDLSSADNDENLPPLPSSVCTTDRNPSLPSVSLRSKSSLDNANEPLLAASLEAERPSTAAPTSVQRSSDGIVAENDGSVPEFFLTYKEPMKEYTQWHANGTQSRDFIVCKNGKLFCKHCSKCFGVPAAMKSANGSVDYVHIDPAWARLGVTGKRKKLTDKANEHKKWVKKINFNLKNINLIC